MDVNRQPSNEHDEKGVTRSLFRIAATALVLLLGYHLGIITGCIPPADSSTAQIGTNRIMLERYIFRPSGRAPLVMAGSSYTSEMLPEYFTRPAYNLGLGGHSSATGVTAVRLAGDPPHILLVEMSDCILQEIDHTLLDQYFSPMRGVLYRYLPMLRASYQPANVVVNILRRCSTREKLNSVEPDRLHEAEYHRILMRRNTQDSSRSLVPQYRSKLLANVTKLRTEIDALRHAGVRVILFRPPRDPEIERTIRIREIDALLHDSFPATHYEWLHTPPGDWQTRDGSHLLPSSAALYANHIIRSIGQPPQRTGAKDCVDPASGADNKAQKGDPVKARL